VTKLEVTNTLDYLQTKDNYLSALNQIEEYADKGYYIFGCLYYELGFLLEDSHRKILSEIKEGTKLCVFFVFKNKDNIVYSPPNLQDLNDAKINVCLPKISKAEYLNKIDICQNNLKEGMSYELNFTFEALIEAEGNPFLLYQKLKRKQKTKCSSYFYFENGFVLSLSPEIFWEIDDPQIKTKPMKGTIKRGISFYDDTKAKESLMSSEKEKAENVMITDLFRNDLGKISEIGSVKVQNLFHTEALDSIWQMTSEISAKLKPNIILNDLIKNLFPSGSVTGAPKISSMEILHTLEKRNRGIYTGSIMTYEKQEGKIISKANVAIRTLCLSESSNSLNGYYAVGSGITILAKPEQEYEECLSKLAFLNSPDIPDFEILETIRFYSGRYSFLNYHLDRMEKSSERFLYPFDRHKALETLDSIANVASGLLRIRLLLNAKGDFRAESYDFTRTGKNRKVNLGIANQSLELSNPFLYHKTTIRDFYTNILTLGSKEGFEDMILCDADGNISETCFRNIFYKIKDNWYTPTLTKGGLPGTLRQKLLDKRWLREKNININELAHCDMILVGNSLRGLERVNLIEL